MAKGLRSSQNKANKSKLRSNVFGPVDVARKERLSARMIGLASKSQPNSYKDMKMTSGQKGLRLHEQSPRTTNFSDSGRLVTTQEIPEGQEAHNPASENGTLSLPKAAFVA